MWTAASAYTASGELVGNSGGTEESGTVTITALPASRVRVKVVSFGPGEPRTVWYGGTSHETARPVRVAPGLHAAVTVALPS